jgi:hypothetical protein
LNSSDAESRGPELIDAILPRQELLGIQRISVTDFFQRQQSAADGGHNFRLAPNHPTFVARRRQIRDGQRASVEPDYVLDDPLLRFIHFIGARDHSNKSMIFNALATPHNLTDSHQLLR